MLGDTVVEEKTKEHTELLACCILYSDQTSDRSRSNLEWSQSGEFTQFKNHKPLKGRYSAQQ